MKVFKALVVSGAFSLSMVTLAHAAPDQTFSLSDKTFMMTAARGSVYELQLSRLAEMKAKDASVKQFARMVVRDHATADEAFDKLAKTHDLTVPTELSAHDQTEFDKLKTLSGSDFDVAYLQQMKLINQEDIKSEQEEISSTSNIQLKQFVETMQSSDEKHNKDAEQLSRG